MCHTGNVDMNARKQYLEALGKEYNWMQRDDI
jgi:hypothetical protein